MAGQVENTKMTPMQTLDSLKQQIMADGKVTQEEIQVFEQNCNTMLANKEITDENFNEALGWYKKTPIVQRSPSNKELAIKCGLFFGFSTGAVLSNVLVASGEKLSKLSMTKKAGFCALLCILITGVLIKIFKNGFSKW